MFFMVSLFLYLCPVAALCTIWACCLLVVCMLCYCVHYTSYTCYCFQFSVSPSPVNGNRCSFWNVLSTFLEYRMMDKVQKPSNSKCYAPISEPFRIYIFMKFILWTNWNEQVIEKYYYYHKNKLTSWKKLSTVKLLFLSFLLRSVHLNTELRKILQRGHLPLTSWFRMIENEH
jgi:hypothetical protein